MPNTILHKRKAASGSVPTAGNLTAGELAINTADGVLYTKTSTGAVVNLPVTSIRHKGIEPASVDAWTSLGGSVSTDYLYFNDTLTNINGGLGQIVLLDGNPMNSVVLDSELGLTLYAYSGAFSPPDGPGGGAAFFSTDRLSGTVSMYAVAVEGGIVSPGSSAKPGIQSPQTGLFLWQNFR